MINKFGLVTGISDHTLDNVTSIAAVSLGASIIEKHFTLDRNGGGPDDSFSLELEDMANLCLGAKNAWSALGTINYERKASEESNLKFRRSLYFIKDLKKGDTIMEDSIKSIRPGYGLPPKLYPSIHDSLTQNNGIVISFPIRLQELDTDVCGHYCTAYCLAVARGVSHETFLAYWDRKSDKEVENLIEGELKAINSLPSYQGK